jgi:clan AA aspartic protease (TIGR02281 family)
MASAQGVPQDYAAALSWYRKAADQGHAEAQYNLGVMYANGQGVAKDYVIAHMRLSLAAAKGYNGAAKALNRDIVAAKMTSAQIAEAQKLAREWRQKLANAAPTQAVQKGVPLKMDGGIFVVPVQISGTITLDFVIDSGAADVSVPADVVSTLMRAGTIKETDFIGQRTYVLADGSKSQSATFTIRSLRVGDTVLDNVRGSVASSQGSLLLGQSFLEHFKSWSIDNTKHELFLEPR